MVSFIYSGIETTKIVPIFLHILFFLTEFLLGSTKFCILKKETERKRIYRLHSSGTPSSLLPSFIPLLCLRIPSHAMY
ncbi:hypothetical protein HMPREF0083_05482 [Aneurinibacillus aneurinilyticus ATCC 12856]|uniref:Uncharacterized protein n=1 Tax=Aneurinibacillus aneurinilyticus ATCC 12856 TaxID=649747 RepID=U1WTC8_ANEAE|nr:hypothetical protein HMPREF0083_05482 [Aneurinibacillus aneurinilyticus ATCC 12856]